MNQEERKEIEFKGVLELSRTNAIRLCRHEGISVPTLNNPTLLKSGAKIYAQVCPKYFTIRGYHYEQEDVLVYLQYANTCGACGSVRGSNCNCGE
jgi:hypothetical protein